MESPFIARYISRSILPGGQIPNIREKFPHADLASLRERLRCTEDVGPAGSPGQTPLFLQGIPRRIFGAADRVLHLASRFLGRPFGLRLGIAG
jgi:hypothetical protein